MKRSFWQRATSSKVLMMSIAIHLVFAAAATYFVVQRIQMKRKMTFEGGPPTINASQRALEHKVSLGKKKAVMSAPAQAKRIMSTGLAKVALPELPSLPSATDAVPNKMGGMGGVGMSFGSGGGGSGLGGGGGSGINFFGLRSMIRSVVFVIDNSNSMVSGNKTVKNYEELEQEIGRVLSAMDPMAKFGMVLFSGDVIAYGNGNLRPANMFDKREALNFMKKNSPAEALDPKLKEEARKELWHKHVGTRTDLALERAFAMKPDTVFVVSDGEPTGSSKEDVLKEVAEMQKKTPRPVTINVIAYYPDENVGFLQNLANQNGGQFRLHNPKGGGK